MNPAIFVSLLLGTTVVPLFTLPWLIRAFLKAIGDYVRDRARTRRQLLFQRARTEEQEDQKTRSKPTYPAAEDADWEKIDSSGTLPSSTNGERSSADWEGVVGFFHPFCNAGGGGERVLWAAIRATQQRFPKALCVVYTGDHDVDKDAMLSNVSTRFNIHLYPPRIAFRYLSTRHYVLASTWSHFTLLGQSLGSLLLAWDAFNLVVPDVFIDTMGYAFALAFSKLLFPSVPTAAYVHYPTISTDMLGSLSDTTGNKGVNAGLGSGYRGRAKRIYWELFAWLYSRAGGTIDIAMTNSSWTQSHILSLWSESRRRSHRTVPITTVFPPVAVSDLTSTIPLSPQTESSRSPHLLYISQFRPEKNHSLIISAFARFVRNSRPSQDTRLILAGSVRDDTDSMLVYTLRVLAREEGVKDRVDFVINAPWSTLLSHLKSASVGVNGMWNEHFGIGVVEYQAAGLISVVNDSGGPKRDIVVDIDGGRTGYWASDEAGYAKAFETALGLGEEERVSMRQRARKSAGRFTEAEFRRRWVEQLEVLVSMTGGN
ncbi:glycosyltransferase family 4 protein [Myriangium duriaei CBS 260.36]|uniref:GDP-Man:Man(3)GlcNAc(2)-PP-Dol alpha-1,2-mannosyltransferase n=1 Tax=Myriangium duriaei CBS 260.36 TaxID=1168546 RepID=A0A9P4J5M7_9PEZI|nr:glycosyltransferase family 4 protein [Myriangium duriaei CBS 260.36]